MGRDQNKSQGKGRERGQGSASTVSPGGWNDRAQRDMQQGDLTRPARPDGTSPLDKDEHPINKNRPVQQNR